METRQLKKKIHQIIFEADTKAGKLFDILLFVIIITSVVIVMLDSVGALHLKYGNLFLLIDWIITIIFTMEYILRIYSVKKPLKYILSFYGIIDRSKPPKQ